MKLAETVVGAVRRAGGDTLFGVPGGGPNLAMIGAAQAAGMRFVLTHTETAGAITAATYGLLRGAPAMAIATRGPGAASAVNGAAQATLDRYPLLLVTDCVGRRERERVAHQRLDQTALLAPAAKWSGPIGDDALAPEAAAAAVALAGAAPRGAVHLDFDPSATSDVPPLPPAAGTVAASPEALDAAAALLRSARRTVAVVGFDAVDDAAGVRLALERLGCPVLTTYQAIGVLPEGHPQLAGLYTGGAIERPLLDAADLLLAVGLDTVEPIPTAWPDRPTIAVGAQPPASTFVAVDVALDASPAAGLRALVERGDRAPVEWAPTAGADALAAARAALAAGPATGFGPLELVRAVAAAAPPDVTVTVDAGAHFLAVMPYWPVREPLGLLISNGLATMGFALPAAIGAGLARPGRPVLCLTGDGGLGMTLAELETLARLRLPVTVVVFDDATLSLIRVKQRPGQGEAAAVRYETMDFAAIARAVGLEAAVAERAGEVTRLLDGGWDRPRLIDARIDPAAYAHLITTTRG